MPKNLVDFINDNSISLLLRRWAVVWLSALSQKNSWQQAETILKNKNINLSIRKGAAGGLAIFSDPKAMKSVNEVMWDKETHEDLRLYCYWALTWSSHKEAKNYINSALDHFDNNISSDAKNRMKK